MANLHCKINAGIRGANEFTGCADHVFCCEMVRFRKTYFQETLWPIFNFLALPAP
jgi:hypothetical protein